MKRFKAFVLIATYVSLTSGWATDKQFLETDEDKETLHLLANQAPLDDQLKVDTHGLAKIFFDPTLFESLDSFTDFLLSTQKPIEALAYFFKETQHKLEYKELRPDLIACLKSGVLLFDKPYQTTQKKIEGKIANINSYFGENNVKGSNFLNMIPNGLPLKTLIRPWAYPSLCVLEIDTKDLPLLPREIAQLWTLEKLKLESSNGKGQLRALPLELGNLKFLRELSCAGNKIRTIDFFEEAEFRHRLEKLNVANNLIEAVRIGKFSKLTELNIQGNPIKHWDAPLKCNVIQ